MTKRRITKASKCRLTVFGTLSVVAVGYFLFSFLYNLYTIYDLTKEKEKLEEKYTLLQKEAEDLKIDIEKLNDPDYLANYARENYLYSKDGEYVLQLKEEVKQTDEQIDIISDNIEKNYIIMGLIILIMIIFICIIKKGKKRNTKKKKKGTKA